MSGLVFSSYFRSIFTEPRRLRRAFFVFLFVFLAILPFFLYLRGKISADEGCYLFLASNIQDVPDSLPFSPPGMLYLFTSLFFVFGESLYAARSVVFITNALSAVLLFFIGKKLWGEKEGMLASLLFLIAVSISAFQAHFVLTEPFMVFFALLAVLFFIRAEERPVYLVLSGIAIGLSLLFKQFVAFLVASIAVFYLCGLWSREKRTDEWLIDSTKQLSLIFFGFLVPAFAVVTYYWATGALGYFIHDFIIVPMRFSPELTWPARFFKAFSIVWVFSSISVLAIIYGLVTKRVRSKETLVAIWFLFSLLILSRVLGSGFGHYLIALLPPACLLASMSLIRAFSMLLSTGSIRDALFQREYVKITAMACAFIIIVLLVVSTISTGVRHGRAWQNYKMRSFDEQVQTANYIQSHIGEDEYVYCFSNAPPVHFLSGRHPPVRFLYTAPVWVPDANAEGEVIDRLEESNVKYIVVVPGSRWVDAFQHILKYIEDNYRIEKSIGMYDIYRRLP